MTERPLSVLLLGDPESGDFRSIVERVRGGRPPAEIRLAADFAGFRQLVEGDRWFPDLVAVLQAWPDQFPEAEVHELLARCPLARIVCCFGPWCDSDGRTRSLWPLAVRIPVAAARGRLSRELALLEDRESASAALPLTASRAEIFEFDFGPCDQTGPPARSVAVISPDRRWTGMLESRVRAIGLRNLGPQSGERPEVVIFDADPWNAERAIALRAIRAADREAQIVAAVGFPRPDLAIALRESGADKVWFKLAPLQALVDDLSQTGNITADDAETRGSTRTE
ncbi:MAG: hypothetical protein ACM3U2_09475 [Deltaproteobacteria bacterium]